MNKEIQREWNKLGPGHFLAKVKESDNGRSIHHEYLVVGTVAVEIDKLFQDGEPVAAFRSKMDLESSLDPEQEEIQEEIEDLLKELALDDPQFQLTEEFEASVEVFRANG